MQGSFQVIGNSSNKYLLSIYRTLGIMLVVVNYVRYFESLQYRWGWVMLNKWVDLILYIFFEVNFVLC